MNVLFDRKFFEDIKIIRDVEFKKKIEKLIEKIEVASILAEIQNIRKIIGAQNAYRIRIGNYRIGITNTTPIHKAILNGMIINTFDNSKNP